MIWLNPWAWLGLIGLSFPIIIHLLGRGRTRLHRFPSLRFLPVSRLLPTRRTRLRDVPLLLVRLLILVAAVVAMARPLVLNADRQATLDGTLSRVIVVDTSASIYWSDAATDSSLAILFREANRLAGETDNGMVLATADPVAALPGAVAWLGKFSGRSEINIISDFQDGTLSRKDLDRTPADVGITLLQTRSDGSTQMPKQVVVVDGNRVTTTILNNEKQSGARWEYSPAPVQHFPRLLTTPADSANAALAAGASEAIAYPYTAFDSMSVAIAYVGSTEFTRLGKTDGAVTDPALMGLVLRLGADSLLRQAVREDVASDSVAARGLVIARGARHQNAVVAVESDSGGQRRLYLLTSTLPGSVASASLIAAVRRSSLPTIESDEHNSVFVSADSLNAWNRITPSAGVVRRATGDRQNGSDGRWLWGVALLLLGLEWWMRRRMRTGERGADAIA